MSGRIGLPGYMIFVLIIFIGCGLIEPKNQVGSISIQIVDEQGAASMAKTMESLSSLRCILKKGTATKHDQTHYKSGGSFTIEIDDLEPGSDYSIQLYGLNSGGGIIGRGSRDNIRVSAGDETSVSISWSRFNPTLASPANGTTTNNNKPTFSWYSVTGASVYALMVSNSSGFSTLWINESSLTGSSYASPSALADGTYYWRVRARDSQQVWGEWSSVWSITIGTAPSAPTLSSPSSGSTNISTSPTLSWNASSGAASYGLQVSSNSSFSALVYNQSGLTGTSQQVTGLSNSAIYYWRVNATNSAGTSAYSSTWNFTTSGQNETMTGNDGKVYQTVQIGDQVWMAENLRETQYRNGDAIPNVTDNSTWAGLSTGARCAYNNSETTANTYGYLYNWYAVDDSRNLAPSGWRVPTDGDWKALEMHLGMSQSEADNDRYRGTNEGSKLAGNASLWASGDLKNNAAFGESGFTALPGGYRSIFSGSFHNLGYIAYFWSATEYDTSLAWSRLLYYSRSDVRRFDIYKRNGFSVRLIRD